MEFHVNFDLATDEYGFQLPLTFAPNITGDFAAGVRLNWQSRTEELEVQIIATRPFGSLVSGRVLSP
jgi:hypothetical protein